MSSQQKPAGHHPSDDEDHSPSPGNAGDQLDNAPPFSFDNKQQASSLFYQPTYTGLSHIPPVTGGEGSGASSVASAAASSDHLKSLSMLTEGAGSNAGVTPAQLAAYNQSAAYSAGQYAAQYAAWQQGYGPGFGTWPYSTMYPTWMGARPGGKKGRMTYHRQQTMILEGEFRSNRYITKRRRLELQQQIYLTDRQIKIWFQNRRMKEKKEKKRAQEEHELAREQDGKVELQSTMKPVKSAPTPYATGYTAYPQSMDAHTSSSDFHQAFKEETASPPSFAYNSKETHFANHYAFPFMGQASMAFGLQAAAQQITMPTQWT